jgi:hypothetical protein
MSGRLAVIAPPIRSVPAASASGAAPALLARLVADSQSSCREEALASVTAQSAPNLLSRGAPEARRGLGRLERTGEWPYHYVKTRSSWLREVLLSLVKTLLRWYLAVRAEVEAVTDLDRGDKGGSGPPGMPGEVTPL